MTQLMGPESPYFLLFLINVSAIHDLNVFIRMTKK